MYNSKNFSVMAYANGFTLWSYTTPDSITDTEKPHYFDDTAPFIRAGDMVIITADNEAPSVTSAIVFANKITDGTVSMLPFASGKATA